MSRTNFGGKNGETRVQLLQDKPLLVEREFGSREDWGLLGIATLKGEIERGGLLAYL